MAPAILPKQSSRLEGAGISFLDCDAETDV
jgi:hypothetical protein